MNKIDLKINKNGNIVCLVQKNNKAKYIDYENVLEYIGSISRENDIKLSIINNTITFSTNNMIVTIDNYSGNKDDNLQVIIERLVKEKIRRRNEYLKRKKVKRQRVIKTTALLGSLMIVAGMTVSDYLTKFIKNNNQEIDVDKTIPTIIEETRIENKISDLMFEDKRKTIEVNFIERTDTVKYKEGKQSYNDIISYYSNIYGIDPKIMLAIAIQESGEHRINQNTPAIGLMQIEKLVWVGKDITGFNYKTQKYETLHISEENLNNLDFNIRVACMYFQQCLKNSKNNLEVAIQMYNYGYGNINKVLSEYSNGNITLKNVEDLSGNEWLKYREIINKGDPLYLEHVLSYIENSEDLNFILDNQLCKYSIKNTKKNFTI